MKLHEGLIGLKEEIHPRLHLLRRSLVLDHVREVGLVADAGTLYGPGVGEEVVVESVVVGRREKSERVRESVSVFVDLVDPAGGDEVGGLGITSVEDRK